MIRSPESCFWSLLLLCCISLCCTLFFCIPVCVLGSVRSGALCQVCCSCCLHAFLLLCCTMLFCVAERMVGSALYKLWCNTALRWVVVREVELRVRFCCFSCIFLRCSFMLYYACESMLCMLCCSTVLRLCCREGNGALSPYYFCCCCCCRRVAFYRVCCLWWRSKAVLCCLRREVWACCVLKISCMCSAVLWNGIRVYFFTSQSRAALPSYSVSSVCFSAWVPCAAKLPIALSMKRRKTEDEKDFKRQQLNDEKWKCRLRCGIALCCELSLFCDTVFLFLLLLSLSSSYYTYSCSF